MELEPVGLDGEHLATDFTARGEQGADGVEAGGRRLGNVEDDDQRAPAVSAARPISTLSQWMTIALFAGPGSCPPGTSPWAARCPA